MATDDPRPHWHEAMAVLQDRHRWSEAEAFRWLQHEAIARRVKISVVADEVVGNPSSA